MAEEIVFCKGGGCTAKLGAGVLSRVLSALPKGQPDPNLLVGYDSRDDAAGDLRGVHAVAADARRGITQSNDVTACLHELEADDQAYIAGTEHEHALTRQNMM